MTHPIRAGGIDPSGAVGTLPAKRPIGLTIVALLALAQAVLAVVRAGHWIYAAGSVGRRGAVLLPLLGAVALAVGVMIAILAVLYAVFAWGAMGSRRWARPIGLVAAVMNGLVVLILLSAGDMLLQAVLVAIVPVVVIVYLLAPAGRRAFGLAG
jgi:hypothetical protein